MALAAGGLRRAIAQRATADDAAEWDRFVRADTEGSFCHLWAWQEVLRESFGQRSRYLLARDEEGVLAGVLPLVRVTGPLGRHLVSMPYLNYGGPVGSPAACVALSDLAVREGDQEGARLELRNRAAAPTGLTASRDKVTVVLPLPATVEALWEKTFRAKLRSQVRRAQREEMTVRFGPDEVGAFHGVFARNMRDLGTPVLPRRFFEALLRHFPTEVVFGAVYAGETPVAAGCGFLWKGEFEMTWASSLREFNAQAPNMLLYASFMEEMISRGADSFNFGRCTPGGGTHRFKLQWGAQDEPLHWTRWPAPEEDDSGEPGRAMQLASRAWQRLPLPVANLVGPAIAARLPHF